MATLLFLKWNATNCFRSTREASEDMPRLPRLAGSGQLWGPGSCSAHSEQVQGPEYPPHKPGPAYHYKSLLTGTTTFRAKRSHGQCTVQYMTAHNLSVSRCQLTQWTDIWMVFDLWLWSGLHHSSHGLYKFCFCFWFRLLYLNRDAFTILYSKISSSRSISKKKHVICFSQRVPFQRTFVEFALAECAAGVAASGFCEREEAGREVRARGYY